MPEISAERAYLFRHPLLREACYQLQLPSSRARLHALALQIMEKAIEGEPGSAAAELADHAACAQAQKLLKKPARLELARIEVRYRMLAASHAMKNSDLYGAVAQLELVKKQKRASPRDAASARMHLGVRQMALGKLDAARANLQDAHKRALKLKDVLMAASIRAELGNVEAAGGNTAGAERIFNQALVSARQLGNPKLESVALGGLAGVAYRLGNYARALDGYLDALAASERAQDPTNVAINQMNISNVMFQLDRVDEALEMSRELCRRLENSSLARLRYIGLSNLANYLESAGITEEASKTLAAADELSRSIGATKLEAQNLDVHARLRMREGDLQSALEILERAIVVASESGLRVEQARTSARRAVVLARRGQFAAAQSAWDAAIAQFNALRSREYEDSLMGEFAEAMNPKEVAPK